MRFDFRGVPRKDRRTLFTVSWLVSNRPAVGFMQMRFVSWNSKYHSRSELAYGRWELSPKTPLNSGHICGSRAHNVFSVWIAILLWYQELNFWWPSLHLTSLLSYATTLKFTFQWSRFQLCAPFSFLWRIYWIRSVNVWSLCRHYSIYHNLCPSIQAAFDSHAYQHTHKIPEKKFASRQLVVTWVCD